MGIDIAAWTSRRDTPRRKDLQMPSHDGSMWSHEVMWSHELSLPRDPMSASRARDFVRGQLRAHRLPHLVDDVELVVSELATNALVHARTPLVITIQSDGMTVLLTVLDYSSLFKPPSRRPSTADGDGRGLLITDLVSDDWGVMSGSRAAKSVWASFSAAAS